MVRYTKAHLFHIRPVSSLVEETHESGHELKRAVGPLSLTALGVGAIVGTGIFVVVGEGLAAAGPAVILSFVLAAVVCLFSALSYAELASSIPVSGSAYTYAYATLGEVVAWVIGWDLILEYGVSVAAIAVGWGANFNAFLETAFGVALPERFTTSLDEGGINIPAVVIVLLITLLLMRGVKETANLNTVMVFIKLGVLAMFIGLAFTAFNADNLQPFTPHGSGGILTAAALIFFAYIGFDAVATGSEEAKNPKRDLPIAIIGSLAICTIIYVLVSVAAVGALPAAQLAESDAPLSEALEQGAGLPWAAALTAFGALVAITSVLLVILYGQTRIFFAMARDGLVPESWATINPRTRDAGQADPRVRHFRRSRRRGLAVGRDRGDGEHRHAVRIHPGQHRRDGAEEDATGHGAAIQGAVPLRLVPDRDRAVLLPDNRAATGHLHQVRRMARDRGRDLSRLRVLALQAAAPLP